MRRFFLGLAIAVSAAATPSLAQADDRETAQQIAENLRGGNLKGYSIEVRYHDGKALMKGTVASEQQRALALAIAQQSQGVSQVIDELSISGGAATTANAGGSIGKSGGKGVIPAQANLPGPNLAGSNLAGMVQGPAIPQGAPIQQAAPIQQRGTVQRGAPPRTLGPQQGMPVAYAPAGSAMPAGMMQGGGAPIPAYVPGIGGGVAPARYDQAHMPNYAWPAYAAYPNYGAVTYPKQYSPTAWPFIGPFYPYPQVPLGWRKVTLEWDDGWWMLDFKARRH